MSADNVLATAYYHRGRWVVVPNIEIEVPGLGAHQRGHIDTIARVVVAACAAAKAVGVEATVDPDRSVVTVVGEYGESQVIGCAADTAVWDARTSLPLLGNGAVLAGAASSPHGGGGGTLPRLAAPATANNVPPGLEGGRAGHTTGVGSGPYRGARHGLRGAPRADSDVDGGGRP
jgi:hypothetical protein